MDAVDYNKQNAVHVEDETASKDKPIYHENASPEGEVLETRYALVGRVACVKLFWRAIIFCCILHWAALNDGFQQQIPGNIIPLPAFIRTMADTVIDGEPAISAKVVSYWQGFAEMSKTLGMFTGGTFADRFGRKTALIGAVLVLLVGSILEITANDWRHWLGGAIIIRLGVGLAQAILVTFVSEISPFQIRGFMIGAYQLSLAFGQLIVAVAAQLFTVHLPDQWKPLVAIEFVFTGILLIIIWFVPESHLYHARKGNHEAAKRSMVRLYGTAPNYDVDYEYRVVQHGIEAEREFSGNDASFFEIFKGVNGKRTLAGCVGICSQWAAGAPIVFGFSTYFFARANLGVDPFIISILTFVLLIVAITFTLIFCERIGRRPLLVGGCFMMLLFNIGLASTGFSNTAASGKAAVACLLLWVICYGLSAGPLGFVAAGETSTPRLRAQTTSFNLGCYGLGFVVFQWSVSYMISADAANLGVKAIYVWAGLLVPTVVILYFFYPETSQRTYNELDELYERGIAPRHFKKTQTMAEQSGPKRRSPQV